jgi:hypothetical protein
VPPVLTSRTFHLAAGGRLVPGEPAGAAPARLVLTDGQTVSFDLPLPAGAALAGRPEIALWTEVLGSDHPDPKPPKDGKAPDPDKEPDKVHAHLRVTVSDCGAQGCERIAKGEVNLERATGAGTVSTVRELSRAKAVAAPGDLLRLTLELEAKPTVSVVVLHDAATTPSRLVLAGDGVATTGGEGVAGAVLVLTALGVAGAASRQRG